MNEINTKIPSSTLAELRGVLVRALSRENLSNSDIIAIRKSRSSSSLKINCTWSSNASYGGKKMIYFTHVLGIGIIMGILKNVARLLLFPRNYIQPNKFKK